MSTAPQSDMKTDKVVPLAWHTEQRRLDTLVPLENNPFGKITTEKRRRLELKLLELGVFEAATLDTDGVLLTFNKRHNLLMGMGRGQEHFAVMVPNRALTGEERMKIVLASNINEGEWIDEILRDQYADVLSEMGLELAALDEQLAGEEAAPPAPAEFPIVAEFSEKYDAVVIVCRNEIDANYVREVLGLGKEQSYKAKEVGTTRVIDAKAFCEKWKSKS
ncbi:hypothetical protein I2I05_18880 [Hymenobacter sp. BT683]|uniref:Uncharacterized protein n=1 Tax=Hymenobacter jeongseonensis TaxID=2791027 RepID=A0ABS0INW2_9BACT|nr:hypothetical protein [Hymenobacter jeongseonensis]MBF9239465.1 hypothetical protein [Hymenobacter jeongseonensis]